MPELPEVETIARILNTFLPGKTIQAVRIIRAKNIENDPVFFANTLKGKTFLHVSRRGKYLLFHLTDGWVILSHLRMEGKYFEAKAGQVPNPYDIVFYDFTDGSSLRYEDVRKFGRLRLNREEEIEKIPPLSELGPEPWEAKPDVFLTDLHRHASLPIKSALMDQHILAGIGNIYADETLFAAKISPKEAAKDVDEKQANALLSSANAVLKEAILEGGSTIRSYHPKQGMSGQMQNHLEVYGKGNTPCPRCGAPLRSIRIGQRSSVYCPVCQHEEGKPFIVGISGPIASGKSTVSAYLAKKGYRILDADELSHEAYTVPSIRKKIARSFGEDVLTPTGIDRAKMLNIVSEDSKKRKRLERIIHPYVYQKTQEVIDAGKDLKIAIDMPLLLTSPFLNQCDLVIRIAAPEEIRYQRLIARGVDPKRALELNRSFPMARCKKAAGILLDGSGSLSDLEQQLDAYPFL